MDTFVIKGEKLNVKHGSDGTHSNKNSLSISGEESAGHWRCSSKRKLLRSNHPYYRNVAKHLRREPQIIQFKSTFDIWFNIGYICESTFSAMSRIKSRFCAHLTGCNNLNFIVLLLLSSQISQKWSAPNSIRCFINVSRMIYLFQ